MAGESVRCGRCGGRITVKQVGRVFGGPVYEVRCEGCGYTAMCDALSLSKEIASLVDRFYYGD